MAIIHAFSQTNWKPNMVWPNCQIRLEEQESSFVLMEFVVQEALLCPVFDSNMALNYIIDTVDGDMFLCVNRWS